MDETQEDRRLKMMPVVDEYTREYVSIPVDTGGALDNG
jgi:hypothetical protein